MAEDDEKCSSISATKFTSDYLAAHAVEEFGQVGPITNRICMFLCATFRNADESTSNIMDSAIPLLKMEQNIASQKYVVVWIYEVEFAVFSLSKLSRNNA